jgi:hypothetical protein
MKGRSRTLAARSLVLLFSGVAPVYTPKEACDRAPFHSLPPSQEEWQRVMFDRDDIRVRLGDSEHWRAVEDPRWSPEAILEEPQIEWSHGGLGPDSIAAPWSEIQRLEAEDGDHTLTGMGVGILGGVVAALILTYATEDPYGYLGMVFTVPIGLFAGGLIGSFVPTWSTIYCRDQTAENSGR